MRSNVVSRIVYRLEAARRPPVEISPAVIKQRHLISLAPTRGEPCSVPVSSNLVPGYRCPGPTERGEAVLEEKERPSAKIYRDYGEGLID